MSFRTTLIVVNLVGVFGLLGFVTYRYLSLRRNPEVVAPANLTTFFDDEVLEGPKLERVLFVSLIALVVSILALVAYFLWEPFRAADASAAFKDRSITRGAVLFANNLSEHYDSTKSLLCANCHGVDAAGGSAPFVIQSQVATCDPNAQVTEAYAKLHPECLPQPVAWAAPNLQLAGLRYSKDEIKEIVTYGRPGTPMPAWGVASGRGALDDQSINDLANYIESIKTTPAKAQELAAKQLALTRSDAAASVTNHQQKLADDLKAQAALPPSASADETRIAAETVAEDRKELAAAVDWNKQMQAASDGQILFQSNCARCHTRGWSYFDPANPVANPPPGPMGGGAYGPNLTNGDVNRQFPPPNGESQLFTWISEGLPANQGYGLHGISSGRMPHFGEILTEEQIRAIMAYERTL